MSRLCIFCGIGKVTDEHVFPKWLHDAVVPPKRKIWVDRSFRAGRDVRRIPKQFGGKFNVTATRVCAGCNGGWMSALEATVGPWVTDMVLGIGVTMAQSDARALARWVAKTGTLFQYTQPPPQPAPPWRLRWLFTQPDPPNDTIVWLASYSGAKIAWIDFKGLSFDDVGLVRRNIHAHLPTLVVRQFVLQVLLMAQPDPGVVHTSGRLQPYLSPIWPSRDLLITWPPPRSINDALLLDITNRFTGRSDDH